MEPRAPLAHCNECPLRNHAFVPPSKVENALMAVVGEAPGYMEAVKGTPFVGPSGALLWAALRAVDIQREEVHVTNAVLCFPGSEGVPPIAARCCKERLIAELEASGAEYILSLGNEPRQALTGEGAAITIVRGRWVRPENGQWALPTVHPAYVLRSPEAGGREYLRDIAKFAKMSPKPFVPTETMFWHYPDSKMRRWLDPRLAYNHDEAERQWLKEYCAQLDIEWVESANLLDNKAALRILARVMVQDIVVELQYLTEEKVIAIDLETTGYLPYKDRILNLSLSWAEGKALVISGGLLWHKDVQTALKHLFETENIVWIGHNGKFDMKFLLSQFGMAPELTHDTFILHSALDERSQLKIHALKPLVSQYFDVADYEAKTIKRYLPNRKTSFANVPPQLLGEYAGMDTDYTRRLWFELMAEVAEEPPTLRLYTNLLMPAVRAFIPIELHGIQIDWERLTYVAQFLEGKERKATARLGELVGDAHFNPNSHLQMKRVLWEEKGYEPPRSRGQASLSTNKEILKLLASKHPEDEFLSLVVDIRRYRKLMSSYVRNLYKFEDSEGRVHPVFNVTGSEVGRLSARDPAIQTIPRAYEPTGKLIRDYYVASKGYVLLEVDYGQAELRCAAVLAQDEFLLSVYREGRDLHNEVALALYGEHYTKEQRSMCKMFNFAYLYGGTEYSFAYDTGMDAKEATAWVRRFNELMEGLSAWRGTQFHVLQEMGYVESPTGRRRRFPLLLDKNRADAKKAVVHAPCAGTASDLTLAALVEVQRTAPEDEHLLIMVHDSNIAECPDDDDRIAQAAARLKRLMGQSAFDVFGDEIPFVVDVDIGYRSFLTMERQLGVIRSTCVR